MYRPRLTLPTRRHAAVLLAVAALATTAAVRAQEREFPPGTRIGLLQMGVYPQARIDGRDVVFSPGARIRDRANMLVLPLALTEPVRVRFTTDPLGQVDRAWVLTTDEIARAARERR